jgi:hypothetical protein
MLKKLGDINLVITKVQAKVHGDYKTPEVSLYIRPHIAQIFTHVEHHNACVGAI